MGESAVSHLLDGSVAVKHEFASCEVAAVVRPCGEGHFAVCGREGEVAVPGRRRGGVCVREFEPGEVGAAVDSGGSDGIRQVFEFRDAGRVGACGVVSALSVRVVDETKEDHCEVYGAVGCFGEDLEVYNVASVVVLDASTDVQGFPYEQCANIRVGLMESVVV